MARVPLLVTGALAILIAGYAWVRALTFSAVTGPQRVQWYDSASQPIDTREIGESIGNGLMINTMILGDRLIVPTSGPRRGGPGGFAWISPSRGEARIAWPIESDSLNAVEGVAVRDPDHFGLVLNMPRPGKPGETHPHMLAVGIAGPDGWTRAPVKIAEWDNKMDGRPLLLAASWIGEHLEVVVSHPTGEDTYGARGPVDLIRVPLTGPPIVRSHPFRCEDCQVAAGLPTPNGWNLVAVRFRRDNPVELVDEAGTVTTAPAELQSFERYNSDRTALGTLWGIVGTEHRVLPDGKPDAPLTPPLPGWQPLYTGRRLNWSKGVLRADQIWTADGQVVGPIAQRIGDRAIVTRTIDEDLQLVGATPDTLVPTIFNSSSYDFRIGAFLPRPGGGYYWMNGQGDYVTLDDQLRRTDPLSLRHHLRTRGSVGDFIDEPSHEIYLGWALFGLPLVGLLGGLASWRNTSPTEKGDYRLRPLMLGFGVYAVTGALCLFKVLPLL